MCFINVFSFEHTYSEGEKSTYSCSSDTDEEGRGKLMKKSFKINKMSGDFSDSGIIYY